MLAQRAVEVLPRSWVVIRVSCLTRQFPVWPSPDQRSHALSCQHDIDHRGQPDRAFNRQRLHQPRVQRVSFQHDAVFHAPNHAAKLASAAALS